MTNKSFEIKASKLNKVFEIFNRETDSTTTIDVVETEICADWNEGDSHQAWINSASPQSIADWLASFYQA